jgi:hypothetical protein
MSINAIQLRTLIVRPTLIKCSMWSQAAENLMMGTCAQESHLGQYLKQIPNGPALGIYQIEAATYHDIKKIVYTKDFRLRSDFLKVYDLPDNPEQMIYDLQLATVVCRLGYARHKEPLPRDTDVVGMARYWKEYHNTKIGKGTIQEFIINYELTR